MHAPPGTSPGAPPGAAVSAAVCAVVPAAIVVGAAALFAATPAMANGIAWENGSFDDVMKRAKAEKKIAKIKNELRAEEAGVDAWLERRRAKTRAKLDALGHSLDGATAGKPRRVARRARPKR